MRRRAAISFRNLLLVTIYLVALGVAAALVWETLRMARALPPVFAAGRLADQQATVATPTSAASAAPLITLPTAAPPTPTVNPARNTEQVGYHPKSGRYIVAWLPPIFRDGARESFEVNKDIIDDISPFWYATDGSGRLFGNRDDALVALAHDSNIRVIPTIHNVGDPASVIALLHNPQRRSAHIRNIVDEVLARNYDGIDIDYEALDPSMRGVFSAFIIELAGALHAHDKVVTVAVHAKDRDWGGLGGYQDWAAIGPHIDQLRIMTYDYSWRGSSPGPVAPAYWIQAVAEYARTVVDPSKVLIGVHFYGYDWPTYGNATARAWSQIEEIISSQGATVNFVERNARGQVEESTFTYRAGSETRTVWFMTKTGLASKLHTIQQMDLAGIAIWQLGYEKPEYWEAIREELIEDPSFIQRSINPLLPEH